MIISLVSSRALLPGTCMPTRGLLDGLEIMTDVDKLLEDNPKLSGTEFQILDRDLNTVVVDATSFC